MSEWTLEVVDEPDLTIPEDVIVRAKLVELKPRMMNWTPTKGPNAGIAQSKQMAEWWWEIQDPRYNPNDGTKRRIKGECEAKISNSEFNQFRAWASGLTGREFAIGARIAPSDLIGLEGEITVKHERDRNNSSKVWERVYEVIGPATPSPEQPPF